MIIMSFLKIVINIYFLFKIYSIFYNIFFQVLLKNIEENDEIVDDDVNEFF